MPRSGFLVHVLLQLLQADEARIISVQVGEQGFHLLNVSLRGKPPIRRARDLFVGDDVLHDEFLTKPRNSHLRARHDHFVHSRSRFDRRPKAAHLLYCIAKLPP